MLAAALATGGGAILAAAGRGQGAGAAMAQLAARTKPAGSDLGAIEHVVFLMQENRSFDHYYGTYPGVRGFDDHPKGKLGNFAQAWPGGRDTTLLPFHLDTASGIGECTNDLDHSWPAEHSSWNNGHQQRLRQHARAVRVPRTRARRPHHGLLPPEGPSLLLRAGRRLHHVRQLPLLGARADASQPPHGALGHRRPHGRSRRPGLLTNESSQAIGSVHWDTMPEVLEDAGVSWKVYNPPGSLYSMPFIQQHGLLVSDAILPYFSQYQNPSSTLYQKAFTPLYPNDFVSDIRAGTLPVGQLDHPARSATTSTRRRHPPSASGSPARCSRRWWPTPRCGPRRCSSTCTTRTTASSTTCRRRWRRSGTPGEYLTVSPLPDDADGTAGPIGMGFRVPMLVLSPFSRGGHVASEVFDHTSQLRFLEERFGVKAPNISAWRRHTAGDLTSTLHPKRSDPTMPKLPSTSKDQMANVLAEGCTSTSVLEAAPSSAMPNYPVPAHQVMPTQETA